ncbi:MAG: hypothetical protein ABR605_10360, partial [Desulfurivibrionaceae bacterium]
GLHSIETNIGLFHAFNQAIPDGEADGETIDIFIKDADTTYFKPTLENDADGNMALKLVLKTTDDGKLSNLIPDQHVLFATPNTDGGKITK